MDKHLTQKIKGPEELEGDLFSLKEIERNYETNHSKSFLDYQTKLKEFFLTKDKLLGEEILKQISSLKDNQKENKIFIAMLQNLIKAILKSDEVVKLGIKMAEVLPGLLGNDIAEENKSRLIKELYFEYQRLKDKTNLKPPIFAAKQTLMEKAVQTMQAGLQEIDLKIKQNQEILKQLATWIRQK